MYNFTGEYICKVDAKGRVRLPSALVKQVAHIDLGFVLNRGFEKHLMLFPKKVWEKKTVQIDRLNIYNKKHRQVIRYFYRGATEMNVDSNDRLLIPQRLLEYAGIESSLVMFAYQDQIEIWSEAQYDAMMDSEPGDFSEIANEVFGSLDIALGDE